MLTLEETLDQLISDEHILYGECEFETIDGWYRKDGEGETILIDSSLTDARKRSVVKAHELGHHFVGVESGVVSRNEARARRWETEYLMPVDTLIEAFYKGYTTPFDLADYLEITVEELYNGIVLYQSIHGLRSVHGQYVVTWQPFSVKKDKRRKLK